MRRKLIDADEFTSELTKAYAEQSKTAGTWERLITTQLLASFSKDVTEVINKLPTVDIEPHWIPCNERLPENMEPVNITWVNRDPVSYYMHIKDKPFTATGIYFKGKWYWWSSTCDDILCEYGQNEIDEVADGVDIVAWMPLPKPYEVEDE
ncbi:MAG: DUF551 domain-containing protein [Solobacterium sp.]|nr:DUF551 domain-containing protein [Solobacterium sp.]